MEGCANTAISSIIGGTTLGCTVFTKSVGTSPGNPGISLLDNEAFWKHQHYCQCCTWASQFLPYDANVPMRQIPSRIEEANETNDSSRTENEATIKKASWSKVPWEVYYYVKRGFVRITLPKETERASILKRRRSMQNHVHEIFVKLRWKSGGMLLWLKQVECIVKSDNVKLIIRIYLI